MEFKNQYEAMQQLKTYADNRRQAILITGPSGAGKTYLAKQYSCMLNINNFQVIDAKVGQVREAIESVYSLNSDLVLCIENLDKGTDGASYALLKFLEEPESNVFLVVTCRNARQIPATIISRCVTLNVPGMTSDDLIAYAKQVYPSSVHTLQSDNILWKCIKSPFDISAIAQLNPEQLQYISGLCGVVDMKNTVNSIVWRFQKFPDSTPTPIRIVIRYLMYANSKWVQPCINCLDVLATGRIGVHAALTRLAFELKYGWV